MRSVSSFSLVDVPNDDSESDRKGEALERRTVEVRGGGSPPALSELGFATSREQRSAAENS